MFTGIVETVGIINHLVYQSDCLHLTIIPQKYLNDLQLGDSISVNGVCLTVTEIVENAFSTTVVPETLRLTNLKNLALKNAVNLERSLLVNSRLGGHFMQGHIDDVGEILEIKQDGESAFLVKIKTPVHLSKYIVKKGYIGLDGMSITVVETNADTFTVTLIPFTQETTLVKNYQIGSLINIEVDILSKYIEKLLGAAHPCHLT